MKGYITLKFHCGALLKLYFYLRSKEFRTTLVFFTTFHRIGSAINCREISNCKWSWFCLVFGIRMSDRKLQSTLKWLRIIPSIESCHAHVITCDVTTTQHLVVANISPLSLVITKCVRKPLNDFFKASCHICFSRFGYCNSLTVVFNINNSILYEHWNWKRKRSLMIHSCSLFPCVEVTKNNRFTFLTSFE